MLKALAERFSGAASRMDGRTDLLEAICAACALVAAADGEVDDEEITACKNAVRSNEVLKTAFKESAIDACIDKMLDRASSGRAGRSTLMKELTDIREKEKIDREFVIFAALDVADHGDIEESERKVLEKISEQLGLKLSDYE